MRHGEGMTLTTIIILNVALDVALLAGLAIVMTRPARLTAHRAQAATSMRRLRRSHRRAAGPAREARSGALSHAFD
jgi:hypothetical protein